MTPTVSFTRRFAFSVAVLCGAAASVKGENWEGASVSKAVVDADPPVERSISNAYSVTPQGCRAATLYGSLSEGFAVRVDGVEGPRYLDIREETPLFSENGRSVAYCAQKDGKWHWVINGVEGPAFSSLTATSFAFSPDGEHHSYVAILGYLRHVLVVDGKLRATHTMAIGAVFRSDGSLEYMASHEDRGRFLASDEYRGIFRFRVTGF